MIFPTNDSLFCINDSKGFSSNDFSINDYLFCINDSKGYSTNDIPYQRFGSLLAMIPLVKPFIIMIFYQINLNNDLYCSVSTNFAALYQCFHIVASNDSNHCYQRFKSLVEIRSLVGRTPVPMGTDSVLGQR